MKSYCKAVAAALAVIMLLPTVAMAVGQPPKDEVVYVNLTAEGEVSGIYVVNSIYYGSGSAQLDDYGDYSEVKNLTTTQPLVVKDGKVEVDTPAFEAGGERFYYQGTLTDLSSLPWQIAVGYKLDGKAVAPSGLAGASGKLEITLSLATKETAAPIYKDNFALQASLTLNNELCSDIEAGGATVASVGESKQFSYTLLPGGSKSYVISADVRDFEFGGIQIAAVPFSMEIDRPDTSELGDRLGEMKDGVAELDDGALELDDGVAELYDGMWELRDGADDLNEGVLQMVEGLPELRAGAQQLKGSFAGLAAFGAYLAGNPMAQAQYNATLQAVSGGYDGIVGGINDLGDGINALYSGTQGLKEGTQRLWEGVAELKEGTTELRDGTTEFRDETSDIDGEIDREIDKLINQYGSGDYTLPSFVSPRNHNISGLQFVIKTQGIYKEKVVTVSAETEQPSTLWQRIANLFV